MKAGFSLAKDFVPKWRDNDKANAADQLVVRLSMPSIQDVFTMLDVLNGLGVNGGDAKSVSLQSSITIAKEAGSYLPQYVKLLNADDFTIEDVIKFPPYFGLAVELLFALLDFAQPSEDETKNS